MWGRFSDNLWLALTLGIVVVLLFIIGLLRRRRQQYPYERCDALFTAAELRFFRALQRAVNGRALIYGKVRLADVVRVKSGLSKSHFFSAFNSIACKHMDYVLCDEESHAIICVIELDDRSHQRPDRRARDIFVDKAMQKAGIPIFHFPVQGRYAIRELRERLENVL